MTTKLRCPDGSTSASVDGVNYTADDEGNFHIDNPGHIGILTKRPFCFETLGAGDGTLVPRNEETGPAVVSDRLDDPGECPDFGAMPNRDAIVAWMAASGLPGQSAQDPRPELVERATAHHAALVAAYEAQEAVDTNADVVNQE